MRRIRFSICYILSVVFFMFMLNGCSRDMAIEAQKEIESILSSEIQSYISDMSIETDQQSELKYKLYVPKNASKNMPLLVYLHGASGKGDDLSLLTKEEDLPKFLEDGRIAQFDGYILMPQLSSQYRSWSDIEKSICELTEKIILDYSIDKDNVSLAGFSMGGTGAWNIGVLHKDIFCKIIPIAGSAKGVLQASGDFDNSVTDDASTSNKETEKVQKNPQNKPPKETESIKNPEEGQDSSNQNDEMNMYANSDFIEKEKPELDEETKNLIKEYHKNPSDDNYNKLKQMVIANYNEVLERKENKLAELKLETAGKPGGDAIVAEMEELIQDMYDTYDIRIDSSMLRFTDTRFFDWNIADAKHNDFIPVMGAGEEVYISKTPVTNKQYKEFIQATGYKIPDNWKNGTYSAGEDDYPVNFASYEDAAGHMPKDADFNCGVNDGRTSVYEYADVTIGAHGAIDFWGNVWEWTSTVRSSANGDTVLGIKGGAWNSDRTDCRTEYREEGRASGNGYEDVGFRVIMIKK